MSEPITRTSEGDVYEVFAKFQADESLHHVGNVIAIDLELAQMYAHTLYNEWTWSEMIIVPRRDISSVIAPP